MANYKQCIGVRDGKPCRNEAITEFCAFCDPERKAYRQGRVLPTITGGLGGSLSYRALKSAIQSFNRHLSPKKKQPKTPKQPRLDDFASTYKSTYNTKPYVSLKLGERRQIDSLAHMRYLVEHAQDGKYYAIYQSRNLKDDTVNQEHRSRPHYTFSAAEDEFRKGESLWQMKDRIKRTTDPNFIPPNLRMLAIFNWWDWIEDKDRPQLIEWIKKGCAGWRGPWTPNPKQEAIRKQALQIEQRLRREG